MTPNQYQISMPTLHPWRPVTLPDILGDLFGSAPVDDPFARGWNAAMRYTTQNRLAERKQMPLPTNVIFNNPATIVYWDDGTKTVVKCQPRDVFSAETGLTTAMLKKYMGNDNMFNRVINEWLKRTGQYHPAPPALPVPDSTDVPATEGTE